MDGERRGVRLTAPEGFLTIFLQELTLWSLSWRLSITFDVAIG
jgi:hypothetical protein